MRKFNFDPAGFPQEHCCLSIEEIKNRIQERFETIGDEDGSLPETASRCEMRIGTVKYKDGRQAIVCVDLIPNYNMVTMSESTFSSLTGEWTYGDSSLEQREIHDMAGYANCDRNRSMGSILDNILVLIQMNVSTEADELKTIIGTMPVADGREVLVKLSIQAEYSVSEAE